MKFKGMLLTKEQEDLVLYMREDRTRILKEPSHETPNYEVKYSQQSQVDWYKVSKETISALVEVGVLVSFNREDENELSLYDTDWRRYIVYEVTYNQIDKEKNDCFECDEELPVETTLADTDFGALFGDNHIAGSMPMQAVKIYPKEAIQQLKDAIINPTYEEISNWQGVEIEENNQEKEK
jgi:hypothetical protein